MEQEVLVRSFTERHTEADAHAREVLREFIRVAKSLPPNSRAWREVVSLDQNWRDTLSDSQVIKYLRSLRPERRGRKRRRRTTNR